MRLPPIPIFDGGIHGFAGSVTCQSTRDCAYRCANDGAYRTARRSDRGARNAACGRAGSRAGRMRTGRAGDGIAIGGVVVLAMNLAHECALLNYRTVAAWSAFQQPFSIGKAPRVL
jgi:hypothetical protein